MQRKNDAAHQIQYFIKVFLWHVHKDLFLALIRYTCSSTEQRPEVCSETKCDTMLYIIIYFSLLMRCAHSQSKKNYHAMQSGDALMERRDGGWRAEGEDGGRVLP